MKPLALFLALTCLTARAQDFTVKSSSEQMIEGGIRNLLIIESNGQRITLEPPRTLSARVEDWHQTIVFSPSSGAMSVTFTATTNSPGAMPSLDDLKTMAMNTLPGGSVIETLTAPTGAGMANIIDLVVVPEPNTVMKTRHVYIPSPNGLLEMVMSGGDKDFQDETTDFMHSLASINVDTLNPQGTITIQQQSPAAPPAAPPQ